MAVFIKKMFFTAMLGCFVYIAGVCLIGQLLPEYLIPNIVVKRETKSHTHNRLKEAKTVENIDILFIGSSYTYRGFDTRFYDTIGLRTFNLGTSGQTPVQTQLLLKKYLPKMNPKLVIMSVDPYLFMSDGVGASLGIIAADDVDFDVWGMAVRSRNFKVLNSTIYIGYRNLLNPDYAEDFDPDRVIEGNTYIKGGFVETRMRTYKSESVTLQTIKFRQDQVDAFSLLVKLLKSKGIDFVLIRTPVTENRYAGYTNIQEFNSLMTSSGKFIDLNHKANGFVDSLDFYDVDHLNQTGVIKFNKLTIDTLNLGNQPF